MDLLAFMTVLFGGGSSYQPPPPPPVADEEDPVVEAEKEAAADKERDLARKRKGRRSTILTSGLGLLGAPPKTGGGRLTGGKTRLGE